MIRAIKILISVVFCIILMNSCREDEVIQIPESVTVSKPEYTAISGFYLLNEGNMGMNKCTLDYYDYITGEYTRNIYGNANPNVPKELGDVGNDIAIYGSRLYAVINVSNKIEVMRASDGVRIGQIDVPNCRFIKFHKGYAYVTSYAGPVEINNNYAQKGYVAKIDTATMRVVDKCIVGYQPDGIEIVDNHIYVANSGGYMTPNYENTLSVIDISTFSVIKTVPIAINLYLLAADTHGGLWVLSRGNYKEESASIYCYDIRKERITDKFDIKASTMSLCGDSLYVIVADDKKFPIIDVNQKKIVKENYITDGTGDTMKRPYSVIVNPITKDIMVSDAKLYVAPGSLYCFDKEGKQKWNVRTGDIPAHIVFRGSTNN